MPIALQCGACQKQFKARDELAGKTVKCPACQTPLVIPGGQATPQQSAPASDGFQDLLADELPDRPLGVPGMADTKCPGCGAVVNPEAVLCVDCGYDFTKQKQIVPDTPSDREARFQARADKMAGRDVDPVKKKSGAAGHGPGGSGVVWLLFSFEGRIPRRVSGWLRLVSSGTTSSAASSPGACWGRWAGERTGKEMLALLSPSWGSSSCSCSSASSQTSQSKSKGFMIAAEPATWFSCRQSRSSAPSLLSGSSSKWVCSVVRRGLTNTATIRPSRRRLAGA